MRAALKQEHAKVFTSPSGCNRSMQGYLEVRQDETGACKDIHKYLRMQQEHARVITSPSGCNRSMQES